MLKTNSRKLITICWSKIMFNTICCPKTITLWGGGAMVKDLTSKCGNEEFSFHTCNLGYPGYLGDLIREPRLQNLLNHLD